MPIGKLRHLVLLQLLMLGIPASIAQEPSFSLIVIPDTQNAIDFTHQRAEGFAIDSVEIFLEQMQEIANRDGVAFVTSVGDVWQHVVADRDPEHTARGVGPMQGRANPYANSMINSEQTLNFEIPKAIEGYRYLQAANIPFGVAPGNHDYDAWWLVEVQPSEAANSPNVHVGGLEVFTATFGSESEFFKDQPWYESGFRGGGSSAQIFTAGRYRFLHFAFEMQAGDAVLNWAQEVINSNPGLPTLISTHDYLSPRGERRTGAGMNLAYADPAGNNSAEKIWQEFIRHNDQIFMVLSGHQAGQAIRIDRNEEGHEVYQILQDFQVRGQAGLDAGQPRTPNGNVVGIGDGWYRELVFHLGGENPRIEVNTLSSHYDTDSRSLDSYAQWYKSAEQPAVSDAEFNDLDDYVIPLVDFYARYGR
jgi:hypothetical protein